MAFKKIKNAVGVDNQIEQIKATIEDKSLYLSPADEGWSVTDALLEGGRIGAGVLQSLGSRDLQGEPKAVGDESPITNIRLKVLSRQACTCDANGKILNTQSAEKPMSVDPFYMDAPGADTEPQNGDVVLAKGGLRKDMMRMSPLKISTFERQHMHDPKPWKDGKRNFFIECVVDDDGCISVKPDIAAQLLTRNGERLVWPKFKAKNTNNIDKPQRQLTNWLFKEVRPDYKKETQTTTPNNQNNKR